MAATPEPASSGARVTVWLVGLPAGVVVGLQAGRVVCGAWVSIFTVQVPVVLALPAASSAWYS